MISSYWPLQAHGVARQTLPMILLIASLGGIGYAIVSQLLQRRTITTIAFGPWLALGSMINLGYLAWISY